MPLTLAKDDNYKNCLPANFAWGYASASFQIEGGYDKYGSGQSIWHEALSRDQPDLDLETCKSYEMWREDVELLKKTGASAYRFSIAWPRVIPLGGCKDPINEKGIQHYSTFIDALLEANITPYVTIYHWDLPVVLKHRYGGWLCENPYDIVHDFARFARLCFERFGDRVKNWITFNEPHIASMLHALVLVKPFDLKTDPFTMGRRELLAHAHAVDIYRREFQEQQNGRIGITLDCDWSEPIDDSPETAEAARTCIDKCLGWFADPIYLGKPTDAWNDHAGPDHTKFSEEEWKLIKGSSDFFGINHYGTSYTTTQKVPLEAGPVPFFFGGYKGKYERDGKLIGVRGEDGHPHSVPWGFRKLLNHISKTYAKPNGVPIICTENGFPIEHESKKTDISDILDDTERQEYFDGYIRALCEAVKEDGINMQGYFGWSLIDNLEWAAGYRPRFGVAYIDRENGLQRIPKGSVQTNRDIFQHIRTSS